MATKDIDDDVRPLAGAVASDPAEGPVKSLAVQNDKRPLEIVWSNVVILVLIHLGAIYGLFLLPSARVYTLLWVVFCYLVSAFGITAGVHRLWSHRSYKARLPLRIFLAIAQSMTFQTSIYEWCRDHRVHHKYSDTDADPYNAARGFFFAHVGWVFLRKHPDVKAKGKRIDMSDLLEDPVVRIQMKFYLPSAMLICFIIPSLMPLLWNESMTNGFFICALLRLAFTQHCTWSVNSFAHMWGTRPYDKHINPAENVVVSLFAAGDGWHNYHHTFPFDYSTGEFGWKFDLATVFVNFMAWLGLAYDMRKASPGVVRIRAARTGDGSRKEHLQ
ncbi:stearoyl-CoA desaturase 5-like [Branchiostoma lanceolatum]|uniref:stearoyl-CoA desaturase 5-like n=1 Tax=Branchiostoma lanceolatum TaxID=7740 RepID=UPI003456EDA5